MARSHKPRGLEKRTKNKQCLQKQNPNCMIWLGLLPGLVLKEGIAMTKSELIEKIVSRQPQLSTKDVELAVKTLLDHMSQSLSSGERIEIRRSEEHTSELQSRENLVCRLLLEKK